MGFLCSFVLALFAFFSYVKEKRFYAPAVLFSGFWSILVFFASLRLYGLNPTSDKALLFIFTGVCFFIIGSLIPVKRNNGSTLQVINEKRIKYAVLICCLGCFINFRFIIHFISSGFDLSIVYTIMAATVSGDDTELTAAYSPVLVILQQYVGYPLLFTLMPIGISQYIDTKKKKWLFLAIGLILLRFLFDLRRLVIVIVVVLIVFYLLIQKREQQTIVKIRKKISFKKKLFLSVLLCVFFIVFSQLSALRGGEDAAEEYSFLRNLYTYYVGSLPYFSQRIALLHDIDYTFGFTSFKGLLTPIFNVFSTFGFPKPYLIDVAVDNIESLHTTILDIGAASGFNSYATCFFQFYQDGGFIGILFFSLLFGIYSQKLYLGAKFNRSSRDIWKYSYFVSIYLYLSILHFNAILICFVWPFILEKIFYKSNKSFNNTDN